MSEFVEWNRNTIFRFVEYNKFNIWTPLQQEQKYVDESAWLETHYRFCKIKSAITTPMGVVLELDMVDEDDFEPYGHTMFKLLNDISLEKFDIDNNKEEDEDE